MKKYLHSLVLLVAGLALAAIPQQVVKFGEGLGHAAKRAATLTVYHVGFVLIQAKLSMGEALRGYMHRQGMVLQAFQSTVGVNIAAGVPGELAFEGPLRAQPAVINHGTAADIVIGRWFTLAADGTARPGGTGAVGGVLANPKEYSTAGIAGNALAPTMTLPTGTVGSFVYMGQIFVALATAVAIGDVAKYNTTTGVIGVGAPGGGEAAIPNARFIRYANAAAGLAVLELTI